MVSEVIDVSTPSKVRNADEKLRKAKVRWNKAVAGVNRAYAEWKRTEAKLDRAITVHYKADKALDKLYDDYRRLLKDGEVGV